METKQEVVGAGETEKSPSRNGSNGDRDSGGRFKLGNPGGPGNPYMRRTSQLRTMLLSVVTDQDLREVVQRLVELAKGGELQAIRELLDRLVGKVSNSDLHDRIEALEAAIGHSGEARHGKP